MTVIDQLPRPATTTELLSAAVGGEQGAWEQLVRRFEPVVGAIVTSCRLQEADARDAAQRTWLRMIEHHWQIREAEALGGWLRTTARRECLQIIRERQLADPLQPTQTADVPDDTIDIEQGVVDADTLDQLRRLIERLPTHCHQLMSLLFRDDPPPYAELARSMGIPVGSIGPTRARVLSKLRQQFEDGPERAGSLDRRASAVQHGAGLDPAVHVELGEDAAHVHADGLLADVEPLADLAVGETVGQLG